MLASKTWTVVYSLHLLRAALHTPGKLVTHVSSLVLC